ncbi:hypothetical protein OA07_03180 [Aphanizomenon flos-aquae 2012/KM1/D3]|uniref:hypothetical protein n=1 Tax=Aphanizomenon flos-aquae TaxID=1176 RepID=UPI000542E871|nr:hypothetical protein OA07_03180 [Aphanizomenon flos-aquae 2012/KM1/D3]
MQLKRWESPRREGRNDKGRGGAARKRQLKNKDRCSDRNSKKIKGQMIITTINRGKVQLPPIFWPFFPNSPIRYIALEADVLPIPEENND